MFVYLVDIIALSPKGTFVFNNLMYCFSVSFLLVRSLMVSIIVIEKIEKFCLCNFRWA